jgi:hypothetical protein
MKRLLFVTLALTMLSCEKDEIKNCNCNKVVETNYSEFNIAGYGTVYAGNFITRNECTGVQHTYSVQDYGHPALGTCFK